MPQTKLGKLHSCWQPIIGDALRKPYMEALRDFLKQEKEWLRRVFFK